MILAHLVSLCSCTVFCACSFLVVFPFLTPGSGFSFGGAEALTLMVMAMAHYKFFMYDAMLEELL